MTEVSKNVMGQTIEQWQAAAAKEVKGKDLT